ncbi:MAG: hypothetical protein H6710_01730 [Myxococcales bacterium]|nr:hypothetical protein [Myxococcales bacterium]MCB9702878.1 hypothetical protein [Myxococcales bacterium]
MADLRAKLGRIVEDITSLEVNTILCDGMTGEQMTDPRQALFDVGSEYIDVLRRLIPGYEPPPQTLLVDPICGSREVFRALHKAARDGLRAADADGRELAPHDRALLTRVKVKSGQLVALFDRLKAGRAQASAAEALDNELCRAEINGRSGPKPPPLPLSPDDFVLLRKTWELSTETIAMQSVITLDGDVVSRIQRGYADERHAVIHRIHGDGLRVALASWRELITAIGELVARIMS